MAKLTDKEVDALEQELIGDRPFDPIAKRLWLESRLADARQGEQNVMNAFRLHKYLRDDEAMRKNKEQIREIRNAIEYLEGELKQLAVPPLNG